MDAAAQPGIALLALMLEAVLGYPARLHRRVPHPVVWVGQMIGLLEHRWNRPSDGPGQRRIMGVLLLVAIVLAAGLAGNVLTCAFGAISLGWILLALIATTALAQKSLHEHVAAVAANLRAGNLAGARTSVAMIVGRDTTGMSEQDVARAAIESLSESLSDGVVAPAFWLLVGGLPGAFAYKAVNTADSMVGHKEPRYRAFGWAAARMDDLLNLLPARLAGALICVAGGRGWRMMAREAGRHASPNAGWPEAAMAAALHVELGGAVSYDNVPYDRPLFNAGGGSPCAADLDRALRLYRRACGLLWLIVASVAAVTALILEGN